MNNSTTQNDSAIFAKFMLKLLLDAVRKFKQKENDVPVNVPVKLEDLVLNEIKKIHSYWKIN